MCAVSAQLGVQNIEKTSSKSGLPFFEMQRRGAHLCAPPFRAMQQKRRERRLKSKIGKHIHLPL